MTRDIDLLLELQEVSNLRVSMTVETDREDVKQIFLLMLEDETSYERIKTSKRKRNFHAGNDCSNASFTPEFLKK